MGVILANSGAVNGFTSIRNIKITPLVQIASGMASNTNSAPVKKAGNADWSATMDYYGKIPPAFPGDAVSFVAQTGGGSWTGTGICQSIKVTAPIESGGYLGGSLTVQGNGALTTGATSVTDSTSPAMYIATSCKANFGGSDVAGVKEWTLDLAIDLKTYVQSGVVMRVGSNGNKTATASLTLNEGVPATLIQPGTIDILKLYVDSTTFYELRYCIVPNPEQSVPIEAGDLVSATIPLEWSGWKDITGTPTRGKIDKPGAVSWWA